MQQRPGPATGGSSVPESLWGKLKAFLWGFFLFEWYHELQHERAKAADALNLFVFGQLIGLPLMNSPVALRLLPHLYPTIDDWKHRHLEEREVIEEAPHVH